jgi:O-antigen ligase
MSEAGSPILIVANDITFLAITAPLALALVYQEPRSVVGILAALAMTLILCAGALYDSRGATLTFLAATACTAVVLRFWRYLGALLLAFAILIPIAFFFDTPLLSKFSHIASDGRLSHWATAWSLFLEAPLLGHGLHTFIDTSLHPQGVAWAHSLYLQTLAEQGIVGLLALLPLLSYPTVALWRARRSPIPEQRVLAAGAFGALAGFCLASLVELTLLREWVVLVMFVLLAVAARLRSATVRT